MSDTRNHTTRDQLADTGAADALCTCTCGECVHAKCCWCGKANPYSAYPSAEEQPR